MLLLQQSPWYSQKYHDQIARYTGLVHRAARWMIETSNWDTGLYDPVGGDYPYTHRRYLDAAALGLTGLLTRDQELVDRSRLLIRDGLALQWPDGVNPEKGGYDSSYEMVGLVYAERYEVYFAALDDPDEPIIPGLIAMIDSGLAWEKTRISPLGLVDTTGNTRTAGQERKRDGTPKGVAYTMVFRGLAYWSAVTNDKGLAALAVAVSPYFSGIPIQ